MPLPERTEKIRSVAKSRQPGLIVVLEDIHDPHNAQAIARTADAFGIQDICLIFEKEKAFNPKRIGKGSSSSANKWLDYRTFRSAKACFETLKSSGYSLIATALTENADNLYRAEFPEQKLAIVVGNEHRGLSAYAIQNADRIIRIPMHGFVESLNVSVAAALIIAEITRQRQPSPFRYTGRELESLTDNLLSR